MTENLHILNYKIIKQKKKKNITKNNRKRKEGLNWKYESQIKYFKKVNKIKKNAIIFWRGHVAVCLSKNNLIHAYGPKKKVLIMNINKNLKLIEKTAKLKVIGIR